MIIIMMGPPGAGKGTYGRRISKNLNVPIIGTGDLCRAKAKEDSELGRKVKRLIEAGKYVPDDIIIEMLKERIAQPDAENGFILDGFPRTLPQAKALDGLARIDLVINLVLPDDIIIQKTMGRRICSECGDPSYNVCEIDNKERGIYMPPLPPKEKGKCDQCGGELIARGDDTKETIQKRLDIYKKQTIPVLNFYKKKGVVEDFHVNNSPDVMVPKLVKLIEKHK